MINITASIVLYDNKRIDLQRAIHGLSKSETKLKLYLIDNSSTDGLKDLVDKEWITYVHNSSNLGFGAAHNIAIEKAIAGKSKFHFIVNPDTYFDEDVITPMVDYMISDSEVGMMMPQVLNNDGSIQFLPKLLPNPYWIFRRKLKKPFNHYLKFINNYELRNIQVDIVYNTPLLSGCFCLLNLEAIKTVGAYDSKFFMYFEDFDLSRRIHQKYKTIYFPLVSVFHGYEGGANKNFKLFKIFVLSAFTYFNKWGWFFDNERTSMNRKTLRQFEKQ